jgi:hypothetical protein
MDEWMRCVANTTTTDVANNERIASLLWQWLNDTRTAYDARLRAALMRLYERAYGSGTPEVE